MHESVGHIWHLKNFYCPNSLGTSWDAKNILKKIFILLSFWDTAVCLHFWVNFKMAARGPERVTSQVFWSFLLPKNFQPPRFLIVKIGGVWKCLMIFLFTFVTFSKQIAGLEKKSYSLEWPANQDERVETPNITVSWTGTKLGPKTCFVNKQLTDISKKLSWRWFLTWFWTG